MPLFSVIIPLDFHRGVADRCLHAWCNRQTLPRSDFELILVAPPSYPRSGLRSLANLLGPQDQLICSPARHDMALCVAAAATANGALLFFSESHVWPEPEVLEQCRNILAEHPDWSALCARTLRVTHNRLSEVEADMYQAATEYGMQFHPWRKINDACFVTRREPYFQSGGFDPTLGHFAEWELAARYCALGFKIGYVPDVCVHHFYVGDIKELRDFTRNFTDGEIIYFARDSGGLAEPIIADTPPEWDCRSNWDRRLARRLVHIAMKDFCATMMHPVDLMRLATSTKLLLRWSVTALAGMMLPRVRAACRELHSRLAFRYAQSVSSQEKLSRSFLHFIRSVIHARRVTSIAQQLRLKANGGPSVSSASTRPYVWHPQTRGHVAAAGFHPLECAHDVTFRWSEPVAMLCLFLRPATYQIRVECLELRPLNSDLRLRFFHNEQQIPATHVSIEQNAAILKVTIARPGESRLAWTCNAFLATDDRRLLGLPVVRVTWTALQT